MKKNSKGELFYMISVIMPVFNEETEDLEQSIESILNQTEKRLELIIILDNPDNSEIDIFLKEYANKDQRIKYVKNDKNIGIGLTLNRGLELSKFDFIARLDADDISQPERLEIQLEYLFKNPQVSMISTNCSYIDEDGTIIGEKSSIPVKNTQIKELLPFGSTIIHSSVMYKKREVLKIGGYRQLLNCQDYDLWLRMIDSGLLIESIDSPLTIYRLRSQSITSRNALRSMLTEEYVRGLHRERVSGCTMNDSFTFDDYTSYLKNNGCSNAKSTEKYLFATQYYNKGLNYIQTNHRIKGLIFLTISVTKDKKIFIKIKNMYYYRKKRKQVMNLKECK